MALITFCGLLTLQVGAAILAAVFFTLAGAILAANIFDYHSDIVDGWFPFSLIFMIIFVVGLIVAGALMFASSYTENRTLAIMSLIVIVILLIYWLILCCFSFLSNPDHVRGVCVYVRCPESFWIGNLAYRPQHIPEEGGGGKPPKGGGSKAPEGGGSKAPEVRRLGVEERMESVFKFDKSSSGNGSFKEDVEENIPDMKKGDNRQAYLAGEEETRPKNEVGTNKEGKGKDEHSRYVFGSAMIGAIILFIINLIFLIFSALVMYSWAQELSFADYYYEDDPPVVVVEDY